jgi:hypothetical protein
MALTREDFVTESVQQFLRKQLFDVHGYPGGKIEIVESFDPKDFESKPTPLIKNYVATGYNFDDEGRQAELGSSLKERTYTIEFFVVGMDATWGKALAQAIKFSLESDQDQIPLLDIRVPERPAMDTLVVVGVNAERQPIPKPAPWQEHIWLVTLRVDDAYVDRFS